MASRDQPEDVISAPATHQNGTAMDLHRLRGPHRPAAALLADCYALLADAVADSDAGPDYRQDLHRLIAAAQQAELPEASPSALPLLVCAAAGGNPASAVPAGAAWRGLRLAIQLLERIAHEAADSAQLGACALGLLGAAWRLLAQLPTRQWRTQQLDFQRTLMQISGARHSAGAPEHPPDLDSYHQLLGLHDGACFALAARCGARCAGCTADRLGLYTQFGHNAGIMLAIANDLSDFRTATRIGIRTQKQRILP
ncbi:MAG TPA: hypothetical protein VFS21_06195, partial [Roseiflexaceae bacterium]|nr:hypothetical protein [Roseiflexaceae bacterium]